MFLRRNAFWFRVGNDNTYKRQYRYPDPAENLLHRPSSLGHDMRCEHMDTPDRYPLPTHLGGSYSRDAEEVTREDDQSSGVKSGLQDEI